MKTTINMEQYPHYSRAPFAHIITKKQWRTLKSGGSIKVTDKDAKELEKLAPGNPGLFSFENDVVKGNKLASVPGKAKEELE